MLDPRFKENSVYKLLVPGMKLVDYTFFHSIQSPNICVLEFLIDKDNNLVLVVDPKGFQKNGFYLNVAGHLSLLQSTLEYIRDKFYYVDDTATIDDKHKIRFKFNNRIDVQAFREGRFSQIYSQEDVDKLFQKNREMHHILTKNYDYVPGFLVRLFDDMNIKDEEDKNLIEKDFYAEEGVRELYYLKSNEKNFEDEKIIQ
jgi:hypothetical protein